MAKGRAQLQAEADVARRKQVDAKARKDVARDKDIADKLAKTPLTTKEQAFIATIGPKMNCGRHVDMPSAADILRYSKLIGRKDIVAPEEVE